MKNLKLSQLEMLIAVANKGSFGAAAAELGCTQSRISHAITELEDAVGARLLTRSRVGCVPTDVGHRVLTKARQIVSLAQSIHETAEDRTGTIGRVRIACFRSVATNLLPQALAALAIEYPGIRVDIDDSCEEPEEVALAVNEGRADIGVAHLPAGQDLVTRPYVSDSYVLVVPASLQLHAPVTWAQFDDLPYIQLACSGAREILEQCRKAGFKAELSRTVTSDSGIAAMVRHGIGYSILPRLAVYPDPLGVKIVDLPIPAKRQFALIALPDTARLTTVQTVMRFICNKGFMTNTDAFRAGLVSW